MRPGTYNRGLRVVSGMASVSHREYLVLAVPSRIGTLLVNSVSRGLGCANKHSVEPRGWRRGGQTTSQSFVVKSDGTYPNKFLDLPASK